jgi:hypothetical protein
MQLMEGLGLPRCGVAIYAVRLMRAPCLYAARVMSMPVNIGSTAIVDILMTALD